MKENHQINKNAAGLSLAIILTAIHLAWFIIIALGFGQQTLSYAVSSYFIQLSTEVTNLNLISAFLTLIRVFVVFYIIGWLLALIYNKINGGKK